MSEAWLVARLRLVGEAAQDPISASVAAEEIIAAWSRLEADSREASVLRVALGAERITEAMEEGQI